MALADACRRRPSLARSLAFLFPSSSALLISVAVGVVTGVSIFLSFVVGMVVAPTHVVYVTVFLMMVIAYMILSLMASAARMAMRRLCGEISRAPHILIAVTDGLKLWQSAVLFLGTIGTCLGVVLGLTPCVPHREDWLATGFFATIVAYEWPLWQSAFGAVVALRQALLGSIKGRCTIAVFRSFDRFVSADVRLLAFPVLGAFGRLEYISNMWLDAAEAPDSAYGVSPTAGDVFHAKPSTDHEWQALVRKILGAADVVVVDVSKMSPSIEWEIATAVSLGFGSRILPIHDRGEPPQLSPRSSALLAGHGREIQPVAYGSGLVHRLRFTLAVVSWMRRLA